MNAYLGFGLYFCVGVIGGLIGAKLNIPAGILSGAMLSVIICKLFMQSEWEMPDGLNFVTQVLVGVMVASTFHPAMLKTLKVIALPVVLSSLMLICAGGLIALLLSRLNLLDSATAYIATSPGAMTALIPMSMEGSGNPLIVTCFHFFRLLFILFTAPWILKALSSFAR
ncbi:MAG: AbrB family transcriptional regulator [Syntrophobacteraceae bacterium]